MSMHIPMQHVIQDRRHLSIQQLLAEQFGSMQNALACGHAIAEKLRSEQPATDLVGYASYPSSNFVTRGAAYVAASPGGHGNVPSTPRGISPRALPRAQSPLSAVGGAGQANVRASWPSAPYHYGHQTPFAGIPTASGVTSTAGISMPTTPGRSQIAQSEACHVRSVPQLAQLQGLNSRPDDLNRPLLSQDQVPKNDAKPNSKPDDEWNEADFVAAAGTQGVHMSEMKSRIAGIVATRRKDEKDEYSETGICQAVAKHEWFQQVASFAILLNVLWLSVDVDLQRLKQPSASELLCSLVVNNVFCAIFCFEVAMRLGAFQVKSVAFMDSWFVFDFVLTAGMLWDTWLSPLFHWLCPSLNAGGGGARVLSVMRVLRIFRVARVVRVFRFVARIPELILLAKSIVVALRSVASILLFLIISIYVYSLVFVQMIPRENDAAAAKFPTVPQTMNFLLLQTLCGFDQVFVTQLLNEAGFLFYILFLSYIFLTSLTLMNMLIGVLCEVVSVISEAETEVNSREGVENTLTNVFRQLDEDGNEKLAEAEFLAMLKNPDMIRALQASDIDVVALFESVALIFQGHDELAFPDIVESLIGLRGNQIAKVKDLFALQKYITRALKKKD
eukprot:TRINITY_DN8921_c0_g1_i1.p1 TRINITY_DN8921_c0_g1~~TRINITY_DN8921_c0_g1_i1.p1  ORF type:complete len:617 (-),score=97.93 TRINITY_DN8921_c0_g1_i1:1027-2877(-)